MPKNKSSRFGFEFGFEFGKVALLGLHLVGTAQLLAEVAGTSSAEVTAPTSKAVAGVDIRPSWDPATGVLRSEDSVELGYQFRPGRQVTYVQAFNTHLTTPGSEQRFGSKLDRGYIRTSLSKLAEDASLGLSLSYQNRIYLPTADYDQAAGMITLVRNYVTLTKVISDRVSVSLVEMPILQAYSRAGTVGATGASANSIFENRVYLIGYFKLSSKFSLSVPLMFHQTRYADFQAGAKNNAAWTLFLWTYPELTYSLTDTTSLGLAYYSGDLLKAEGWKTGTFQFAVTAYL